MLKKLLCVLISALMVISVLPMGVVADGTSTITIDDVDYDVLYEVSNLGSSGSGESGFSFTPFSYKYDGNYSEWEALAESGAVIYFEYDCGEITKSGSWTQLRVQYRTTISGGTTSYDNYDDYYPTLSSGEGLSCMVSASNFTSTTYYTDENYLYCAMVLQGNVGCKVTLNYFAILVPSSSTSSSDIHTFTTKDMNDGSKSYAFSPSDYYDGTDFDDLVGTGAEFTITVALETDSWFGGIIGANSYSKTPDSTSGSKWAQSDTLTTADTWSWTVDLNEDYAQVQVWYVGDDEYPGYVAIKDIKVTVAEATGTEEEPSSSSTTIDTSNWTIGIIGYDVNNGSTWSGVESDGLTASVAVSDLFAAAQVSDVSNFGGMLIQIWGLDSAAEGATVNYTVSINGTEVINDSSQIEVSTYGAYQIAQLSTASFIYAGSTTYTFSADDVITVSVSVPAAAQPVVEETTNSVDGVIYVNEDYHGILITRNGRRHLLCIPHTVNDAGYCTVCHEYIGNEDAEVEVVTIDGVDYVAMFSNDLNAAASGWNEVSLGDSTFATALSTEGAVLQITRDTETLIDYVSGSVYEKFLVGKDYSSYVALSTHGTTVDDEDGLVAYVSDDGTTVTYDGATVYAALSDAGLADLSSYVLISNTSASYTITSVKVLVPADAVTVEEVEVSDPQESGETDSEDDGEDLTVDDSEPETPAETNPTTGAVLALVPMAIAGLAVVASKRR